MHSSNGSVTCRLFFLSSLSMTTSPEQAYTDSFSNISTTANVYLRLKQIRSDRAPVLYGQLAVIQKHRCVKNGILDLGDEALSVDVVYSPEIHRYFSNPHCFETRKELSDELDISIEKFNALYKQLSTEEEKKKWRDYWTCGTEVVCVSYHAERLCSNLKCITKGPVRSKSGENGITSWVCSACSTVQSEETISDLGNRVFEEAREKSIHDSKRHRQNYSSSEGYKETAKRVKRSTRRAGGLPAAMREAAVVICAVLGERAKKDVYLMSTPGSSDSLFSLLCRISCGDDLKEIILACVSRDWNIKGKLDSPSLQTLAIFSRALQFFRAAFKGSKVYRPAFLSIVAALREYDKDRHGKDGFTGTACRLHLLDDFVEDKFYQFEMKKPVNRLKYIEVESDWKQTLVRKIHTLKSRSYAKLFKEYCDFSKLDSGAVRLQDMEDMISRVMNEFRFVPVMTPIKDLDCYEDIPCYIYRIRARARIMAYWKQVKDLMNSARQNTKDGSAGRKLLKDFENRENVLVACAVVFSAFRDRSKSPLMHSWPKRVLDVMHEIRQEETQSVLAKPFDKSFVQWKKELYQNFSSPDDSDSLSNTASDMIREIECYESYQESQKLLGGVNRPLTERDIFFRFYLKWFEVLFRVSGKRISDCCKKLPKCGPAVLLSTRYPEVIVGVPTDFCFKLEQRSKELKMAKGHTNNKSAFRSASGVAFVQAIPSKFGKKRKVENENESELL